MRGKIKFFLRREKPPRREAFKDPSSVTCGDSFSPGRSLAFGREEPSPWGEGALEEGG